MSERIIVGGEDLDLYNDKTLTLNIKVNDISDISTRNSTYSNTNKIPKTAKNTRILQFLGVIGNTSEIPYVRTRCKYLKNDITIIENGLLQVTSTNEKDYSINVFDGVIDLKERLSDKKISELAAVASYNHNRTLQGVINSLSNVDGYIYAMQNSVKDSEIGVYVPPLNGAVVDKMIPQFFVKTVFEAILSEAGYSFEGEIFEDPEFADEVFTMEKGVENSIIDFVELFPDVKQADFLKDVMNRYSLLLRPKKDDENILQFASFNKVSAGDFGLVDWTNKLIKIQSEKYKPEYAKRNLFTYSYSNDLIDSGDGIIEIINENLEGEKTVYKSFFDFKDPETLYRFLDINTVLLIPHIPLIEIKIDGDTGEEIFKALKAKTGLYKLDRTGQDFQLKADRNSSNQTVIGTETILNSTNVRMTKYLNDNYTRIQKIFTNFKEITATFNLDNIDIFNLDLFKIYYLSQKGQYYYINSVKLDKRISTVNMVQINALTEDNSVIIPPEDGNIVISNVNTYDANPPWTFTGGFITTYAVEGYNPISLTITYTQLDSPSGAPTGLVFTYEADINGTIHNAGLPFLAIDLICGVYAVQITDPTTGIQSNVYETSIDCPVVIPPQPSILIQSNQFDADPNSSRIGYKFNLFQPTSAVLKITKYVYTGGVGGSGSVCGSTTTKNLVPNGIQQDVLYQITDFVLPSSSGCGFSLFHKVEIQTNQLTKSVIIFI